MTKQQIQIELKKELKELEVRMSSFDRQISKVRALANEAEDLEELEDITPVLKNRLSDLRPSLLDVSHEVSRILHK